MTIFISQFIMVERGGSAGTLAFYGNFVAMYDGIGADAVQCFANKSSYGVFYASCEHYG